MTQFHDNQEVEVNTNYAARIVNDIGEGWQPVWRKARIIGVPGDKNQFLVRFTDGTRAVFDAEHIREIPKEQLDYATRFGPTWA